ncbi:hypothetical protein [Solimonas soli]|uniref:hypothetical protein n=1 Tax=Solimonas soli TaxID=413479 RepID=UPI0004835197|nr:hypothetical protein [Solimonas soli]
MAREQQRGPRARKIELERRLDANAELGRGAAANDATPPQQATPRGHKAQQAQPHRPGRPSGGNIRNPLDEE